MSRMGTTARLGSGWVAAAFCAVLTGCSGVYHTEVDEGYSSADIIAAGRGSGIQIQVDGKVGDVQGAPLAAAVASAMPAEVDGAAVRYAPCAPYAECPGDHLVWTFGPPAARPLSAYPPELSTNLDWIDNYHPAPNNVTAKVALFQGDNVVATAAGQVDADNPGDPAFRKLISDMSEAALREPGWFD